VGRLDGKRALISGTGGGIGRATALLAAREGAHVVGCDLHPESSAETVGLVRASGGRMWHDTWTFRLDDAAELLGWLHDVLPGLDRRVEPVVAATRLPDVPLRAGAARPDGTLLLHTTVMADSDAEALAPLHRP